MKAEVRTIKIKDIVPDPEQPRRYFGADKMSTLRKSIKTHGVMSPIIVEKVGEKYRLIDGERRFRASTELKLTDIPAIIEPTTNAIERLVRQFNVQEQHEAWTPMEKAQALIRLSEEMGMTVDKVCDFVGTTDSDKRRYTAFSNLADKASYIRNEIPLEWASYLRTLTAVSKRISEHELEKKMNLSDEKNLEHRVTDLIKLGEIKKRNEITQLKDAFTKNPKLITEFIEKGGTPSEMFTKSKARGAYHLRNMRQNAAYVVSHAQAYLKIRDIKITPEMLPVLKRAQKALQEIIDLGE